MKIEDEDCGLNESEIAEVLYRFDIEDSDGSSKNAKGKRKEITFEKFSTAITGTVYNHVNCVYFMRQILASFNKPLR